MIEGSILFTKRGICWIFSSTGVLVLRWASIRGTVATMLQPWGTFSYISTHPSHPRRNKLRSKVPHLCSSHVSAMYPPQGKRKNINSTLPSMANYGYRDIHYDHKVDHDDCVRIRVTWHYLDFRSACASWRADTSSPWSPRMLAARINPDWVRSAHRAIPSIRM